RLRSQDSTNLYNVQEVSRMASNNWKTQPPLVKQFFYALSKLALRRHKETYPDYVYRPKGKQNKKNDWLFIEVDTEKFKQCKIDENITKENQEEKGVSNQLTDSARLDEYEQPQVSDGYNCVSMEPQVSNEYALPNNYFQLNDQFQASDEYSLPDEYEPVDEYFLVQVNECIPLARRHESNEYDELIGYIDRQQHDSLVETSESFRTIWYRIQNDVYYGNVQSDDSNPVSSGVTDINYACSPAPICHGDSDTSEGDFTGENLLTVPPFYTNDSI
ncbi:2068_t:CDS:1, partial [Paraglomus occultum]